MKKQILAIDDSPQILRVHADLLSRFGYAVSVAANADAGLRKLETIGPDLILLDINMPGVDGWEFLEMADRRGLLGCIPVIILSGAPLEGEMSAAIDGHQISYLEKTASGADLLARIQEVLGETEEDDAGQQ